jgi:8-oxo-dGTP pyrophosphatase MutT (NUDIX family)
MESLVAVPPWIVESDTLLTKTRVFELRQHRARSQLDPSLTGDFVYLRTPSWVNVVAITPEGALLFVEQYRHGSRSITLEIPGGMVDPGEDYLTAGARELIEETGYAGDAAILIGEGYPNPAIQDTRLGTVLILNARVVAPLDLGHHEELAVTRHLESALPGLVSGGQIDHALVVAAFYHLAVWRQSQA